MHIHAENIKINRGGLRYRWVKMKRLVLGTFTPLVLTLQSISVCIKYNRTLPSTCCPILINKNENCLFFRGKTKLISAELHYVRTCVWLKIYIVTLHATDHKAILTVNSCSRIMITLQSGEEKYITSTHRLYLNLT